MTWHTSLEWILFREISFKASRTLFVFASLLSLLGVDLIIFSNNNLLCSGLLNRDNSAEFIWGLLFSLFLLFKFGKSFLKICTIGKIPNLSYLFWCIGVDFSFSSWYFTIRVEKPGLLLSIFVLKNIT